MIIVDQNPKTWQLKASVDINGRVTVHSGYTPDMRRNRHKLLVRSLDRSFFYVPNIIFQAQILPITLDRGRSSVTYRFDDMDDHHVYYGGATSVLEIMKAIVEKKLEVRYGVGIFGYFTFKKQGKQVYLTPYTDWS
jgi:hypothetical protein